MVYRHRHIPHLPKQFGGFRLIYKPRHDPIQLVCNISTVNVCGWIHGRLSRSCGGCAACPVNTFKADIGCADCSACPANTKAADIRRDLLPATTAWLCSRRHLSSARSGFSSDDSAAASGAAGTSSDDVWWLKPDHRGIIVMFVLSCCAVAALILPCTELRRKFLWRVQLQLLRAQPPSSLPQLYACHACIRASLLHPLTLPPDNH